MALENAAFVDGLVITNPTGSDSISQGDDHIRLIKKVLKATFPDADAAQSLFPKSGFYATMSAGTLVNGSEVKQAFDTDTGSTGVFDLNTEYDTSLYRFTPTNAGYYFITHTISVNSVLSVSQYGKVLQAQIWKDGAKTYESVGIKFPYNANNEMTSSVTAIAYSDGTDYWEPYAYQNCGSTVATVGGSSSRFMAIRVA
jgi:hypothetical protein|tara:strand:+ start:80 stop:676 length:597 start_codon:yes stop_codon:yes gene_type:complete